VFVEDVATPPHDGYEPLLGPYAILVLLTSPAPPQTRLAELLQPPYEAALCDAASAIHAPFP